MLVHCLVIASYLIWNCLVREGWDWIVLKGHANSSLKFKHKYAISSFSFTLSLLWSPSLPPHSHSVLSRPCVRPLPSSSSFQKRLKCPLKPFCLLFLSLQFKLELEVDAQVIQTQAEFEWM